MFYIFFFFQAEDGIRDGHVTGVQTCALPISWVFGSAPKAVLLSEKILEAVDSCTCVSKPITISQSMITAPVFVDASQYVFGSNRQWLITDLLGNNCR